LTKKQMWFNFKTKGYQYKVLKISKLKSERSEF